METVCKVLAIRCYRVVWALLLPFLMYHALCHDSRVNAATLRAGPPLNHGAIISTANSSFSALISQDETWFLKYRPPEFMLILALQENIPSS